MAWTTPRTWVIFDVVTVDLLNTHIKNNLQFLGNILNNGTGLTAGHALLGNGTGTVLQVQVYTGTAGMVRHEHGGVEGNISGANKGGLITFASLGGSGSIIPVGTNGQFLKATSGASLGLEWSNSTMTSTIIAFSRTAAAGSGTQAIACPFPPSNAEISAFNLGGVVQNTSASWGFIDESSTGSCLSKTHQTNGGFGIQPNVVYLIETDSFIASGTLTGTGLLLFWGTTNTYTGTASGVVLFHGMRAA